MLRNACLLNGQNLRLGIIMYALEKHRELSPLISQPHWLAQVLSLADNKTCLFLEAKSFAQCVNDSSKPLRSLDHFTLKKVFVT